MINKFLITKMGFRQGRFDCGIYTHDNGTILALYIDDMLIAGALREVKLVCDKLKSKFGMVSCKPVGTPMEKDKPGMNGGGDKRCDHTL